MRRIAFYTLSFGVIALLAWTVKERHFRDRQMAREIMRGKLVSQLAAAMVVYMTAEDDASLSPAGILSDRFGKDVVDRHVFLTRKADPAAGDIILIERPERVDGEWCFAAFGDGHVKKVRRDYAIGIIRDAQATVTAPAASP